MTHPKKFSGSAGLTLVELLATLAVLAVTLGISALYLTPFEGKMENGLALTESFLRQSRSSAIATTSAYRVRPTSSTELVAETSDSCAGTTWTADTSMGVDLPNGVTYTSTGWSVCFSARGMTSTNTTVELFESGQGYKQIQVLLGGTTRVLP